MIKLNNESIINMLVHLTYMYCTANESVNEDESMKMN